MRLSYKSLLAATVLPLGGCAYGGLGLGYDDPYYSYGTHYYRNYGFGYPDYYGFAYYPEPILYDDRWGEEHEDEDEPHTEL